MIAFGWAREGRGRVGVWPCVVAGLVFVPACGGGQVWSAPEVVEDGTAVIPSRWVGDQETGEGVTLVQAAVNGAEGWFLLDSGSEVMVLDRGFADSLSLAAGVSVSLGGCGLRGDFRRAERFRFGPLRFDDARFLAFDLGPLLTEVADQARIVGVLGHPVLEHAVIEIEYGDRTDRVSAHAARAYRSQGPWTPTRWRDGRPIVEATLAGKRGWYAVDTGKSGSLSVASHFAARHGLPGSPVTLQDNRRPCGVSREEEARFEVQVAGLEIPSVDVRFRLGGTEAARNEGTSFDGVMGRHLLRHFKLVLDFANQRVSLIQGRGDRE